MEASYTLEGTVHLIPRSNNHTWLEMEYTYQQHVYKANRTLGFLKWNLYQCPQDGKEAAYKGLFHPILEYGSCVWDPQGIVLQQEIEKSSEQGC